MKMTPLHAQILLHYETRTTPYAADDPEHQQSISTIEFHQDLVRDGLLERSDYADSMRITARGRAMVAAMLATPLPEQAWIVRHPVSRILQGGSA